MNNKKVVGEEEKYVYDPNITDTEWKDLKKNALKKLTTQEEKKYINNLFELYDTKYNKGNDSSSGNLTNNDKTKIKNQLTINNLKELINNSNLPIKDVIKREIKNLEKKVINKLMLSSNFSIRGDILKSITINNNYENNEDANNHISSIDIEFTGLFKKIHKRSETEVSKLKNEIKNIIKNIINDKIHEIVKPIRDKLIANKEQQKANKELAGKKQKISIILKRIIQLVCELINRSFEGRFINSSVKNMREVTQELKTQNQEIHSISLNED